MLSSCSLGLLEGHLRLADSLDVVLLEMFLQVLPSLLEAFLEVPPSHLYTLLTGLVHICNDFLGHHKIHK